MEPPLKINQKSKGKNQKSKIRNTPSPHLLPQRQAYF
jgi:hypothetical protein